MCTPYMTVCGGSPAKSNVYAPYIGLARTINIRCIYGIFGRETTKYTVIYGEYMRLWPTLTIYCMYVVLANPVYPVMYVPQCLPLQ